MSERTNEQSPRQLTGWKEIAGYFGRGVRTVQRWEAELSLPVRRMRTGRGDTVYALPAELDAWRRNLDVGRLTNGWDRDEGQAGGDAADAETEQRADNPAPSPAPRATSAEETGWFAGRVRTAARRPAWLAIALLVVGLSLVGIWWTVAQPGDEARAGTARLLPGNAASTAQPARVSADVDTLHVHDASGTILWSLRFGARLESRCYGDNASALEKLEEVRDLDGDGDREVLLIASYRARIPGGPLLCLDASGRTRFEIAAPLDSVRFGDKRYDPPWIPYRLFVTGSGQRQTIWAVWIHMATGEFPCLLQRISVEGRVESAYWSAGYISFVTEAIVGGRRAILVGASNNDRKGASVAAFDEHDVRGSAWADAPDKRCHDCPPGGPFTFLVFPRMEVTRLTEGISHVSEARQDEKGALRVFIAHGADVRGQVTYPNVFYDLDPNLAPRSAEISAEYIAAHRQLEQDGRLDHPFQDRDRLEAWPVLVSENGKPFVRVTGPTR